MTTLRTLYHFLGGIFFAIFLITATALFVIAGTFIESVTDSHRYAAAFTYHNPIFITLLWGFFLNILISALRRWPFRLRHVPFLITHIGLLMILGGTLIKTSYGVQGNMGILEGSGSHEISMPNTTVIQVEKRDPLNPEKTLADAYELPRTWSGKLKEKIKESDLFPELSLSLVSYAPHSHEQLETWIKGDFGYISGLKPFPIYDWDIIAKNDSIPISTQVNFPRSKTPWNILGGRTSCIEASVRTAYLQDLHVTIRETSSGKLLFQGLLHDTLSNPSALAPWNASLVLDLNYSAISGLGNPILIAKLKGQDEIKIPLNGPNSLKNINSSAPYLGKGQITIDLERPSTLALLQDKNNEEILFLTLDQYGRIQAESFRNHNLHSFVSYDRGFAGYTVQTKLSTESMSRQEEEELHLTELTNELENSSAYNPNLSPPLQLLKTACEKSGTNFASCCVAFLANWNNSHGWIYPNHGILTESLASVMMDLDWNSLPQNEYNACLWIEALASHLEPSLKQGNDLLALLQQHKWPLTEQLKGLKRTATDCTPEETDVLLTALAQQVFSISSSLPNATQNVELTPNMHARLLSAYFRAYEIHLSNIPFYNEEPSADSILTIESPITFRHTEAIPQKKLEENSPMIVLKATNGNETEWISLAYDRSGQGFKRPVFHGKYLIRFQPAFVAIPFHIRLKQARQINYPDSMQPYSYESDLLITDRETMTSVEKTISMNHVHETWNGYRFYLANIAPPDESAAKHVQLAVNYDPAKYWLTYPGALILSLGILLLFWLRPYQK